MLRGFLARKWSHMPNVYLLVVGGLHAPYSIVLSRVRHTMQVAVLLHGAALNQDGRSSSLTAPNGPAQQMLIRAALQTAHMPPSKVLPAHWTFY